MPRLKPFQDDLPIPDTVRSTDGIPGSDYLSIAATVKKVKLHSDLPPGRFWSYRLVKGEVLRKGSGSTYIGPTVEVSRGKVLTVGWKNETAATETLPFEVIKVPNPDAAHTIPVPENEPGRDGALTDAQDPARAKLRQLRAAIVTHLHGGRTQADSDGWPDDTCLSGQLSHYTYHNDQAATMLWYHDHAMHITRLNVYAGLAGAWLIRDKEEKSLKLPGGDYELPLIIQDRNLDTDASGTFTGALLHKTEVSDGPAEFFGPYTLINGKVWPRVKVEPRLYRLRVLNGSNARTYRLILLDENGQSQNSTVWQVGSDQGLMQAKVRLPDDGLILAPAERADLLVDFSAFKGKRVYLWNTADAPFGDDPANKPDAAHVKSELLALLADPTNSADTVDPANAINRRLFPQVMRFDVLAKAKSASSKVPADPLWKDAHQLPPVDAMTLVRVMGLVEKPADNPADPSATSMLVFWEFVSVEGEPPPAGVSVVSVKYWHPGQGAFVTGQFWKAAQQFYDRINWRIHLDGTELWYVINLSPDTHPVHVHLVDLYVIGRYGFTWDKTGVFDPSADTLTHVDATTSIAIEPTMQGPKDTVRVNPGEMITLAMKFSPFPGRYMYHCHILEHEDHDMMRPFVVVPKWVPHHDH